MCLVSDDENRRDNVAWFDLEVIAIQPELESAWEEFESASTYAYAQREALTRFDRSGR